MNTPPETHRLPAERRRTATIVVILFAVLLAACSSSGGDAADDTTTTTDTTDTTVAERGVDTDEDEGDDEDDVTTTTEGGVDPDPDPDPGPVDPDREPTAFERDYIAELSPEMSKSLGMPDSLDTDCLAAAWVGAIGGERLQSAGLDPETFIYEGPGSLNLDRKTAQDMHRRGLDCGLTPEVFVGSIVPNLADCPEAAITDEDFEEIMIAAYTDEIDDRLSRLEQIGETCAPR